MLIDLKALYSQNFNMAIKTTQNFTLYFETVEKKMRKIEYIYEYYLELEECKFASNG
jgi:hypothetical protein